MADTPLGELTTPFRRSVRAFAEAGAFVRRFGDDRAYRQYLQTLQQLPSSSTFHPFDVTAQWSTDQDAPSQPSRPGRSLQGASARVPGRQPESRQRLAVVNRSPAPTPSALQSPATRPDRTPALVVPRDPVLEPSGVQEAAPDASGWSALPRIAQLLSELESSGAQQTPAGRSVEQSRAADTVMRRAGSSSPQLTTSARRLQSVSPAPVARGNQPSSASAQRRDTGITPEAEAGNQEPALSQLADAVAILWQTEDAPPQSPEGQTAAAAGPSVPAPRAASLLVPAAVASASEAGAEPGVSPAAQERGRSSPSAPSDVGQTQEPLAERLNRALIEQAWLRGVDLA